MSSSGDSDSDSDSEIFHELGTNVNLGLANLSTALGPEHKSSLSAITTGKFVGYVMVTSLSNHFHMIQEHWASVQNNSSLVFQPISID